MSSLPSENDLELFLRRIGMFKNSPLRPPDKKYPQFMGAPNLVGYGSPSDFNRFEIEAVEYAIWYRQRVIKIQQIQMRKEMVLLKKARRSFHKLSARKIKRRNFLIAKSILIDGKTAAQLADKHKISRGRIFQIVFKQCRIQGRKHNCCVEDPTMKKLREHAKGFFPIS